MAPNATRRDIESDYEHADEDQTAASLSGIRAVVRELAGGEEVMPSAEEIWDLMANNALGNVSHRKLAKMIRRLFASRLAPILGALKTQRDEYHALYDMARSEALEEFRLALGETLPSEEEVERAWRDGEWAADCGKGHAAGPLVGARAALSLIRSRRNSTPPAPADELLAEEAARIWPDDSDLVNGARRQREALRHAYERGARREGRR